MRVIKTIGVVCFVLVLAATSAGGPSPQQAANPQADNAATLLAGVVHLSDDDIRFRTRSGICVFVDPVNDSNDKMVVASGMVRPDLILITHAHGDHFQPKVIRQYMKLNPNVIVACPNDVAKQAQRKKVTGIKVVSPNQDYSMAGIDFSTVPSYFEDPKNGHPKAKGWVGYVLKIDGARYYVTGDTEPLPEMAGTNPDVIFPLLVGCGGNLDQAVKMAELSKARVVVPVHFHSGPGTPVGAPEEETASKYIMKLPKGVQGVYYKDARPNITIAVK